MDVLCIAICGGGIGWLLACAAVYLIDHYV